MLVSAVSKKVQGPESFRRLRRRWCGMRAFTVDGLFYSKRERHPTTIVDPVSTIDWVNISVMQAISRYYNNTEL